MKSGSKQVKYLSFAYLKIDFKRLSLTLTAWTSPIYMDGSICRCTLAIAKPSGLSTPFVLYLQSIASSFKLGWQLYAERSPDVGKG